jgi:hypothetical protein
MNAWRLPHEPDADLPLPREYMECYWDGKERPNQYSLGLEHLSNYPVLPSQYPGKRFKCIAVVNDLDLAVSA